MTSTPAQIAIAKLIELAETGEINPWDVQVIEVIDRFLAQLPENKTDLAQSGQAFLWASMLVLLKANTLASLTESPETTEEIQETELETETATQHNNLPLFLEKHLRRRSAAPPLRQRRVTLEELIIQIREIEAKLIEKPISKRPRQSRSAKAHLITQLAHQENLTETANSLAEFLNLHASQFGANYLELEHLLELLNTHQTTYNYDKVGVFFALLLLSAESKVELHQENFYQDLRVKPIWLDEIMTG